MDHQSAAQQAAAAAVACVQEMKGLKTIRVTVELRRSDDGREAIDSATVELNAYD